MKTELTIKIGGIIAVILSATYLLVYMVGGNCKNKIVTN